MLSAVHGVLLMRSSWRKFVLNDLKLKLSWGRNGNQGIDPYGTLSEAVIGPGGGIAYPLETLRYLHLV